MWGSPWQEQLGLEKQPPVQGTLDHSLVTTTGSILGSRGPEVTNAILLPSVPLCGLNDSLPPFPPM